MRHPPASSNAHRPAGWLAVALVVSSCGVDPAALPEMTFEIAEADVWRAPPTTPAPAPGEGRMYVTNNLDDTVTILDLDALEAGDAVVLGTVPVGLVPVEREGPHHCTADPNGEFYYVGISNFVVGSGSGPHGVHGTGAADGHVLKYRVDDNTLVASVRINPNPGDVRLTPDGTKLIATHFDLLKITAASAAGIEEGPELDATLAIVDVETMTRDALVPLCPAPHGVVVTDDATRAAVSCLSDELAIVDLVDPNHAVTRVSVLDEPGGALDPICNPYAVTIDGRTAWTSCYNTGQLIAVDVDTAALDGRRAQLIGKAVFGQVVANRLVIAHQGTDGITLFDTSDPVANPAQVSSKLFTPDVCSLPHAARFSEDGASIFVVCEGNKADPGTLVVIDAEAPHDIRSSAPLGRFPDDIAVMRRP